MHSVKTIVYWRCSDRYVMVRWNVQILLIWVVSETSSFEVSFLCEFDYLYFSFSLYVWLML